MPQFDYKNYQPTGIAAVDAVVACVYQQRKEFRAVKTLMLKPNFWRQWMDWVSRHSPQHEHPCRYEFDGVNIECGSLLQVKNISIEYYPIKPVPA